MKRAHLTSFFIFLLIVVLSLGYTFASGNKPLLGLDLQGGVAVVLQPKGKPTTASVEQAKNIIRSRVDGLGVAEPSIVRQGTTIIVQLPGVKDRSRALSVIGKTAKLEFRPVCAVLTAQQPTGSCDGSTPTPTPSTTPTTTPTTGTTAPATSAPATTAPAATTTVPSSSASDQQSLGANHPTPGENAAGAPTQLAPSTTIPAPTTTTPPSVTAATTTPASTTAPKKKGATTTTTTTVPKQTAAQAAAAQQKALTQLAALNGVPVCSSDTPAAQSCVAGGSLSSGDTSFYLLGPAGAPGEAVSSADPRLGSTGAWEVGINIRNKYKTAINTLFNNCYNGGSGCPALGADDKGTPRGRMAIVLDGEVISAPTVNGLNLADSNFSISGNFTQKTSSDLALVLRYGSLPVVFQKDVNVQEVSATLGKDSLHAGLIAGFVGLALVGLYMVAYYRLLGVVAIFSLGCGAALLWSVIAYLGANNGLALTLAGITGIIVSIGVAVDSNVVFYEHLREDMAKGRTLRSTVQGSFDSAWRTIVSADLVSLIGAALLYWLTVGSVRGFAFYLGLSTILDLVASYFFMRPLVLWMGRSDYFQDRLGLLGVKVRLSRTATEDANVIKPRPSKAAKGGAVT